MPDTESLYDVRERTGNPEHASVADVVDRYGTEPVRTVIHRILVDGMPFRTATHDLELSNVDGIRIGTTAGQFLDEPNTQDDG